MTDADYRQAAIYIAVMNIYVDVTNELKKNELKSFSAYMEGA